jgi:hypothetical protein
MSYLYNYKRLAASFIRSSLFIIITIAALITIPYLVNAANPSTYRDLSKLNDDILLELNPKGLLEFELFEYDQGRRYPDHGYLPVLHRSSSNLDSNIYLADVRCSFPLVNSRVAKFTDDITIETIENDEFVFTYLDGMTINREYIDHFYSHLHDFKDIYNYFIHLDNYSKSAEIDSLKRLVKQVYIKYSESRNEILITCFELLPIDEYKTNSELCYDFNTHQATFRNSNSFIEGIGFGKYVYNGDRVHSRLLGGMSVDVSVGMDPNTARNVFSSQNDIRLVIRRFIKLRKGMRSYVDIFGHDFEQVGIVIQVYAGEDLRYALMKTIDGENGKLFEYLP